MLSGAISCFFFYILKQIAICFSSSGERCDAVFPATLQNCSLDCKTSPGWVRLKQLSLHFWVSLSSSCQSDLSLKKWGHSFDGTASQLKSDVLMSVNLVLRPAPTLLTVIAFHRQHTEIFQPQFSVTKHNHESAFLWIHFRNKTSCLTSDIHYWKTQETKHKANIARKET